MATKLINIANAIMRKVNNDNIDKSYASNRIQIVGEAILNNRYKLMYQEALAANKVVKGFIRPLNNSWVNLISNSSNESFDKFGISQFNNEVLENISKRISLEIDTYKSNYSFMAKNYNTYLEDMLKTLEKEPIVENSFAVQLIKEVDLVGVLEDKSWLNKSLNNAETSIMPTNMSNSIYDVKNDLEVKLLAEEAFKALGDDTISTMNDLLASTDVGTFRAKLSNLRIKDINAVVGLVIIFRDKLLSANKGDAEYANTDSFLSSVIDTYRRIKNQYEVSLRNKLVVSAIEVKEDKYIVYAIEDNFSEYISSSNGSMKTILGAIFTEFNVYENSVLNMFKPLYIKNDDLIVNKPSYDSLRNSIQNAYILKNRNEAASSLRAYYLIALDRVMVNKDNVIRAEAEAYINSCKISDLYDTYNTTMYIVENFISSNTNFKIFAEGVREAKELLDTDDVKPLAGYATLRLILLYLIGQTELA